MKTLGLLFVWLLLLWISPVLFSNIFDPALNWGDLLFYSVIGLIIYLVVWWVGRSLNKSFVKNVEDFIVGSSESLEFKKGHLRVYGFLMLTLLPTLIYLMGLAVYAAATFSLYALWLISYANRIPVGIIIGIAVVALGAVFAFLVSIYYLLFPPSKKPFGIVLSKMDEPNLWRFVVEVGKKIKAKPIDEIIITPDAGIGVYQKGPSFITLLGGGKRVLEVGLPSIHGLKTDQFGAILTHEYGHFSHKDTRWGVFTYVMGNSLLQAFRKMPGPGALTNDDSGKGGSNWVALVMALNPGYYILLFFVKLFFKVTNGFSRVQEVKADIRAIDLFGSKAFTDGLVRVSKNDMVFSHLVERNFVSEFLKQGKVINNFSSIMDYVYKDVVKVDAKELDDLIYRHEESDYDSHPALKIRLEYAKQMPSTVGQTDGSPINTLFSDWENINVKIAEMYNVRLMEIIKVYASAQQQTEQSQQKDKSKESDGKKEK